MHASMTFISEEILYVMIRLHYFRTLSRTKHPREKYKKKLLFLMFKSNLFEALFKHASICNHST